MTGRGPTRRAETYLARSPLQRAFMTRARRRLTVLAYHGVSDPAAFETQLEWLGEHTTPISLDAVNAFVRDGRLLPSRPVLLTFDDGERSLLEVAAPLLREHGIPAVAFVVAGLVDSDQPFWWTEVTELVQRRGGTSTAATAVVRRLKQLPDDERRAELQRLRRESRGSVRTLQLTGDELRKLEIDGVTIGNHTLTHPCLDRCSDDVLRHEITAAHQRLSEILGHPPAAFAYPNGNWDARVRAAVAEAGYELAFAFDHRPVPREPDPLAVSRVRVDATAGVDRLRILVSGLHPALHAARGRT